jgi:hypothetical protein
MIDISPYYLRMLAWSIASSAEKIGTALLLCKVPIPFMAEPVYILPTTGFVAIPPPVLRLG